jgi:hypothetical protein
MDRGQEPAQGGSRGHLVEAERSGLVFTIEHVFVIYDRAVTRTRVSPASSSTSRREIGCWRAEPRTHFHGPLGAAHL